MKVEWRTRVAKGAKSVWLSDNSTRRNYHVMLLQAIFKANRQQRKSLLGSLSARFCLFRYWTIQEPLDVNYKQALNVGMRWIDNFLLHQALGKAKLHPWQGLLVVKLERNRFSTRKVFERNAQRKQENFKHIRRSHRAAQHGTNLKTSQRKQTEFSLKYDQHQSVRVMQ